MSLVVLAKNAPIKLLVIQHDERLGRSNKQYLEVHGVAVTISTDAFDGKVKALGGQYDCILLDLLPDRSGIEVCRELRTHLASPLIMITGENTDIVLGLDAGADDYIAGPLSSPTLLARIRAVVRRARGHAGPSQLRLQIGTLSIDPATMTVTRNAVELALTDSEFTILKALADNAGHILTRKQLLEISNGQPEVAFERAIDAHISRLRAKLGGDRRLLRTIRGMGYVLMRND